MTISQKDIDRFWEKVSIGDSNSCWNWNGAIGGTGYGVFWCDYFSLRAHRFAWEITHGKVPSGKYILHKCDNKVCCNPLHLYCGTHCDNMTDNVDRKLGAYPGRAKLYSGEIWLIRKLHGIRSSSYVAKMFKVHKGTICDIWNRDKYLCKEGYYA